MSSDAFWLGFGVGTLAALLLLAVGFWLLTRRLAAAAAPSGPSTVPPGAAADAEMAMADPPESLGSGGPMGDPEPSGAPEPSRPAAASAPVAALDLAALASPGASDAPPGRAAAPPPSPPAGDERYGSLRVSYRILLHLHRAMNYPPNELPPASLTQGGIGEGLGLGQGALAGPLKRLVLSGAVAVERSHVRGVDRRVNTYRLTHLGEQIVKDLRRGGRGSPRGARQG